MNTDLHKRLEEAANDFADKHGFRVPYDGSNNFYDEIDVKASKDGFFAGAELGYKEAIVKAKEWLTTSFFQCLGEDGVYWDSAYADIVESLDCFETDMNKLWENKTC